jgi:predicted dehydrogenase
MRKAVEWIKAGVIGPVREVHAWAGANRWNKSLTGLPEPAPVPSGLNWDLWLGPRDPRPYSPDYHPVAWRDFWDFGSGTLGDFGCHDMDVAHWALDLAAPRSIESRAAGDYDRQHLQPHGEIIYYDFGPRGDLPPVKLTWYGGGLRPRTPDLFPGGQSLGGRGTLFVGDQGILLFSGPGSEPKVFGDQAVSANFPAPSIPRSNGHYRDWLDACKGGPPASSNFSYGAKLTELTLLGVAALRLGQTIVWDTAGMKAEGLPEADAILNEPRRKGWEMA